jgi:hypothetical protein
MPLQHWPESSVNLVCVGQREQDCMERGLAHRDIEPRPFRQTVSAMGRPRLPLDDVEETLALAADRHDGHEGRDRVPPGGISIQLYTLRDQLQADLDGTLAALHAIGYTRVKHAGVRGSHR